MNTGSGGANLADILAGLAREEYCYLTTQGRRTGNPHEIEIWFTVRGRSIYFLSGGGEESDWVKNIRNQPAVHVKIGSQSFSGMARLDIQGEEEVFVREGLATKYQGWRKGRKLSEWAREALPVAVDLSAPGL
ncbi:MAG TPA: nitroreductase family deazaflavin-dependent oxidoreductase [Anaerolineales bacterium]